MFRILELKPGQPLRCEDAPAVTGPPEQDGLIWLDLIAPTDADLALLGQRFRFHPLALEDCAHADQRPKCEEYGEYMFIVSQGFECPNLQLDEMRWYELHVFLGKNYVVTVHDTAIPGVEMVWKRVAGDAALMKKGADFLYYLMADRIVDDNFPILDQISDSLEKLEDDVLENPQNTTLSIIFALKSQLVLMRKILSPQRDVMALLSRRGDERVSERTALYFRDVHDHLARIVESIESNRDLLGNALEAYLSAQSQRTNEIMKALAILSAVFMPLTFITGFFGQNFEHLPFGSDKLMWSMVISCVTLPGVLLLWFKHRKWF
ncbi:MAG: magnesium and cobalt transporter CorA [Myxococcaceae bacterium]|nr:magnesium and cobalt transporter CorA [Myxococcaceae bacterium]